MSSENENGVWNGYKQLLLPLGHKADVNELTTLASLLVDKKRGKVEFVHVIEKGSYTTLSREWRTGSRRVSESHHIMMKKGIHSERNILKAESIEKGILNEAEEILADAIILGWGPKPRSHISSMASHVLRDAKSDIIVYKKRNDIEDVKKIIFPIAIKPSVHRLQLISLFIKNRGAELSFAHIARENDKSQKRGQELLYRAADLAATVGVDAERELLTGNNVVEILSEVSEEYDLMILGPSGGWWLKRTIFGDLSDRIATNCHCSVLLHKAFGD